MVKSGQSKVQYARWLLCNWCTEETLQIIKPFLMDTPLWGGTIWMLCDYLTFGSNSYSRILSCTKSKCWTYLAWLCDVRNVDWSVCVSDSKGCKEIRTKLWAFLCFYFLITISNTECDTGTQSLQQFYSLTTVLLLLLDIHFSAIFQIPKKDRWNSICCLIVFI